MITKIFAIIGFIITFFYILGIFNIGDFIFYFGPKDKKILVLKSEYEQNVSDSKTAYICLTD